MNNLGCIYLKKDQFENSFDFLDESIEIQQILEYKENNKKQVDIGGKDMMSLLFVNSCRNYNRALACHRFILKLI